MLTCSRGSLGKTDTCGPWAVCWPPSAAGRLAFGQAVLASLGHLFTRPAVIVQTVTRDDDIKLATEWASVGRVLSLICLLSAFRSLLHRAQFLVLVSRQRNLALGYLAKLG